MNFYISPEVIKGIITTAFLIALAVAYILVRKRWPDKKVENWSTTILICALISFAWLGCFTLVKIVWP